MGRLPKHVYVASAGLFTATAYSTYRYAKYHRSAADIVSSKTNPDCAEGRGSAFSVFDSLASVYDQAVGSEETWMGYGLLRSWLLRHAKGKVLEISAGTGRSLPHYTYENVSSLTVTDLSKRMLEQAETKFFDELRLGYKHPDTLINFAVCDAHCIALDSPQEQQIQKAQSGSRSWRDYLKGAKTQQTPAHASVDTNEPEPPPQDEKPKLKPLPGAGSPLNIFRVLIPGWLESSKESTGNSSVCCPGELAPGKEHEFHDENYRDRCLRGCTESGQPLKHFPPDSFDTVVDAFGLCSVDDPVRVLEQAARVCKPGGKVLMLEHGRSSYDWWNRKLADGAEGHKQKWGCWKLKRRGGENLES
mmetsp:Transcript_7218/g.19357  ORF Transcript_7218/g.19357 Transcript_7218/m.19357 type:complete len:360 (+) Transcript_7218:98-1177(+)